MLKLLQNHLLSYFKLNKIIVICLILGGIVAAMAGLYAYGNLMPWTSANSPEQMQNKHFTFHCEPAQNVSSIRQFFSETMQEFPIKQFIAVLETEGTELERFTLANGQPVEFVFHLGNTLETSFPYQGKGTDQANWFYIPLTTVLEHDGEGGARIIEKGSEVTINHQALRCIGEIDRLDILISVEQAEALGFSVRSVYFFSQDLLNEKTIQDYLSGVGSKTGFQTVYSPLTYQALDRQSMPIRVFLIMLLLIGAIFSYGFLAHFMVDAQMKNHAILYLCGFSLTRLRRLIALEILVYSLFCGLVASLLYWPLYRFFLHEHMLYQEVRYQVSDYLFSNLIFVVICLLAIMPFVRLKKRSLDLDRFMREA